MKAEPPPAPAKASVVLVVPLAPSNRQVSVPEMFSVPTVYPEAKGIYVLEALSCGVPVVQPGFRVVETFEASDRGSGGFGSTGR